MLADGSVQVRADGARVGYAGLAVCGSVWLCPVCNSKIMARRRADVGQALSVVLGDLGGSVAFGAYTVRHHAGEPLAGTWDGLQACWRALGKDKSVRVLRRRLRLLGTIRAVEVTYGENGFHPHTHPVYAFEGPVTDDDVAELHGVEVAAVQRAAARLGLDAPTEAAQNLHLVTGAEAGLALGRYLAKSTYSPTAESVAWEATSTQTKKRTRATGSRTYWDLLEAVGQGDADSLDLVHEYAAASKGRRALTWSRGFRSLVGLDVEKSDEDVAAEAVGTREDCGLVVLDWSPIVASRGRLGAELLRVIGPEGRWDEGRRFCDRNGIEWRDA